MTQTNQREWERGAWKASDWWALVLSVGVLIGLIFILRSAYGDDWEWW